MMRSHLRRALGAVWLFAGLTPFAGLRADVLTIDTPPAPAAVQLRLAGVANKDYSIQSTNDLATGTWTTLSTGATDAAGAFQASDPAGIQGARFYRAVMLAPLQTTTLAAATVPGNTVTVALSGTDPIPSQDPLSAIITQLPIGGTLAQMDGTPILSVGTVVSDPQNRVFFVPAAGGTGSGPVSFGYELKRTSNGVTSPPQTVAVSLDPNWVFSAFSDETKKLRTAYSLDGVNWSNSGDLYTAPSGNGVRDSSIVRLNGAYYVAYTAGDFGQVEYVQICRSTDLVHWTYLCNVDTTLEGTGNYSWAPEWFVDRDGTVYLFITREVAGGAWRIFWTNPTSPDLTTWAPLKMVGGDLANRGAIDAQVVRDGETYYLLYRNLGPPGSTDCIEMAKGSSPTTFNLYKTGDWAGWGTPREGPCLVHVDSLHWRLYCALAGTTLNGSPIVYSESWDGMATWTPLAGTGLPQHGTCFALKASAGKPAAPSTVSSSAAGAGRAKQP